MTNNACPVCAGRFGGAVKLLGHLGRKDAYGFDCDACGKFAISGSAMASSTETCEQLPEAGRAALSHWLRLKQSAKEVPCLYVRNISEAMSWVPLTPMEATSNAIRCFGEIYSEARRPISSVKPWMLAQIGFFDLSEAASLLDELISIGILTGVIVGSDMSGPNLPMEISLSLAGWEQYNQLQAKGQQGLFGFVAMQFNVDELEELIKVQVKPYAIEALGMEIRDLRDVSKAGVIDNILREQIRNSAFVLADLTHDNSGAYWEAGFAEGLGKPVIYICEKSKFDAAKTHFDTNHSTTVMWETGEEIRFRDELFATVRRSLQTLD